MHIWGTRSEGLFDWVIGRMDALLTLVLTVWLGKSLCRVLCGMGGPLIGVTPVALDDRVRSALRGVAPHGMSGMHYRAQLRGRCVFVDVYVASPALGQPGSPIDPRAFHAHISNALAQTNQAMSVTATFVACGTDLNGLQSIDNASGLDRPG
ncbi:hypothetical protein [Robbsia sp. KACC 23696]|uniref:hypothetical protein n=1 Tax=Robbsia sp. KACC 23696 TaxID=3149231 RepID=UPI00325B4AF1